MVLSPGDLCTFNKFECKVVGPSADDGKVGIAYAVFLEDGTKIFDEQDIKRVPISRVKLVCRPWVPSTPPRDKSDEDSLPSFSVRQERWLSKQGGRKDVAADSTNASTPLIDLTNDEPALKTAKSKIPKVSEKPFKQARRPSRKKTRESSSSDSSPILQRRRRSTKKKDDLSSDSSSMSSHGSAAYEQIPKPKQRKKKSYSPKPKFDDMTNPVVPDWMVDESSESPCDSYSSSEEDFSQEHLAMRERARQLENKANRGYRSLNDEVAFEWDDRKGKVKKISFIDDTPDSAEIAVPAKKTIEGIASCFLQNSDNQFETIKSVCEYVDSIHFPIVEMRRVLSIISFETGKFLNDKSVSPNLASDMRVWLTSNTAVFKTVNGWTVAVQISLILTWNLKNKLFSEFASRIFDRLKTLRTMQWAFMIASLSDPIKFFSPILNSTLSNMLREYSTAPNETQRVMEQVVGMVVAFPKINWSELLLPIGSILKKIVVKDPPGDLPKDIVRFLAMQTTTFNTFSIDYLRLGGFVGADEGDGKILPFGKHKGKSFLQIYTFEQPYCMWAMKEPEPSNLEMIDLIDYISVKKFWCIPGARSIRADIEVFRLTKQIPDRIRDWLINKVAVLKLSLEFYKCLPDSMPLRTYRTYSLCMLWIFQHMVGTDDYPDDLLRMNFLRGEIVNEVIRPLLRLASLASEWSARIKNAILFARAKVYRYTIEEAKKDLEITHAIKLE